jgi:hypothetical protein
MLKLFPVWGTPKKSPAGVPDAWKGMKLDMISGADVEKEAGMSRTWLRTMMRSPASMTSLISHFKSGINLPNPWTYSGGKEGAKKMNHNQKIWAPRRTKNRQTHLGNKFIATLRHALTRKRAPLRSSDTVNKSGNVLLSGLVESIVERSNNRGHDG